MNRKKHISALVLLFILFLAGFLRLWQLGSVPPSPDWDEAALGYNAYSLLQTGRDEYGDFLPVMLRSFGDFKPPLYAYLIIPFIPIFGLDIIAVRLPSVIAGILAVWLTYLLVKELVDRNQKSVSTKQKSLLSKIQDPTFTLPLLSAALLAISPWHIQFSRVAFEANIGVTLNLATVYFFLRGLRRPLVLPLSSLFAALSLYAYQSEKVFMPLLVIILAGLFLKELLALPKKYLAGTVVVGVLVALPMLMALLTNDAALERARATNILSNQTELLEKSIANLEVSREKGDILGQLVNNRRVIIAREIAGNYLSHFSLNWLFIDGDAPRHHAPFMGLLYLWELPFLLVGLYQVVFYGKKYISQRGSVLLLLWFLAAPIPAAVTNGVPHAVRTLNFLPTFQIFTAVGIVAVFSSQSSVFKHDGIRKIVLTLCSLLLALNIAYYLNQYFVQQNYYYSKHWQYGYKEAVESAEERKREYEKIVVSNEVPMDQSYIFFLYYLQYDPKKYQKERTEKKSFDIYEFRPIEWSEDKSRDNILFIGSPEDFPSDIVPVHTVFYLNGEPAIYLVDPKN